MKNLLLITLLFGFIGFLLESTKMSLVKKHLSYAGDKLFWGVPFLPIYALGGLIIHFIIGSLQNYPWYWAIFVAWLAACGFEYLGGFFCLKVIKRKFWDYSKDKFNISGFICARNCAWWLIFITVYYFFLFTSVELFLQS